MPTSSKRSGNTPDSTRQARLARAGGASKAPTKKTTKQTPRKPAGAKTKPVSFATYNAAMKHLNERANLAKMRVRKALRSEYKLDRMRAILAELGEPQEKLCVVHVAGTKGKGSTCAMAAACLAGAGRKVGVYTSPHLVDVRERIVVDGAMIPTAAMAKLAGEAVTAAANVEAQCGEATFFELLTAISVLWFVEQEVEVAVVECGLGGRLDATNALVPAVSVVAAIARDHTQLLGDDLAAIAREKAGIFKPGVPAVTIAQDEAAMEVMQRIAEEVGADLRVLGREIDFSYRFEAHPKLGPHTCVCLSTAHSAFEHVSVPLQGEHQALNCGLALAAIDQLRQRGIKASETDIIEGLAGVTLPGRMEIAWKTPRILLDIAHNPTSLQALVRSVGAHVPYDSMVMVFGCCEDKDVDGLLRQVALGADKIIFTKARGAGRAMDPHELQQRFGEASGKMSQVVQRLPDALQAAAGAVGRDDLVCVTGSAYLVGEAKKYLKTQAAARRR